MSRIYCDSRVHALPYSQSDTMAFQPTRNTNYNSNPMIWKPKTRESIE